MIQEIIDKNPLLYPKLFSQFMINVDKDVNKPQPTALIHKIIEENECSVPIIIQNMDDTEPILFANKKKETQQFVFNFLKNKSEYRELYEYVSKSKLLGISSNKTYFSKAIKAKQNNKGYCPPQLKNKSCGWMFLIDIEQKQMGFIILKQL
jgi:hypothetical protein